MPASDAESESPDFIDAIPVIPYSNIHAAHDFLVDVVGLASGGLVERDGAVVHGEVRAGDRRFWLHEAAGVLTTPAAADARTGGIALHVRDVDGDGTKLGAVRVPNDLTEIAAAVAEAAPSGPRG